MRSTINDKKAWIPKHHLNIPNPFPKTLLLQSQIRWSTIHHLLKLPVCYLRPTEYNQLNQSTVVFQQNWNSLKNLPKNNKLWKIYTCNL